MKAGDTFFIAGDERVPHLWVVISDPYLNPNRVVLVHFTTYEYYKEDACMIYPGEHKHARHDTCIAYDMARFLSLEDLQDFAEDGRISLQPPVSADLLARIRAGAVKSKRLLLKYLEVLEQQGLVD